MLSFATEFPVVQTHQSGEFLKVIRTWILGSPHTQLTEADLAQFGTVGETRIQRANEVVDLLRVSAASEEAAAVRYSRNDKGLEWVTTVVSVRSELESWVGIRVSCESSHPAVRLPPAKKPIVVRALLDSLGGSSDGDLRVGAVPFRLEDADIDLAARLITGRSGCRLPIVYVSSGFQGQYVIDSDRLAYDLAGMAHVVVEPNRPFSFRLKIEVNAENVYGGTVGVYWPDGAGRSAFFLGRELEFPEDVARALFEDIRVALTNRRATAKSTWLYVQEAASRQAIEALRASGSQEIEKYVETFDREIAVQTQRLEDAEKEISRLRNELRIHEARFPAGSTSLLRSSSEQDLYANEVFGVIRDALEDSCLRVPTDSRRKHVLKAILEANPASENIASSMREQLKHLLRGFTNMDSRTRRGLEDLGFYVLEDGKHFKLVFQGDDRYTFSLPKSGSDHRGGLNAAGDIGRLLF